MVTKINSASERTLLKIILAAERLFGDQGIDAVSLRQINIEAGQKNSSATHYHFGNKKTLINAIYDYRMENVNRRRLRLLEGADLDGNLQSLVEAMVYPIVDEIDGSEGGQHYVRFLAQMIGSPSVDLQALWSSTHGSALNTILKKIEALMSDLPADILGQRFGLAVAQIIHALADRERLRNNPAIDFQKYGALFAANLVDCLTGALSAPISDTTYKELRHVKRSVS